MLNYNELWKAFVRPPRYIYNTSSLGPQQRMIGDTRVIKHDFEILNPNNKLLQCTLFEPVEQKFHTVDEQNTAQFPCIVYCHCNSGCRIEALTYLQSFLQNNMGLCCFDFSGSGLSEGDYVTLGFNQSSDLKLVVDYLRNSQKISYISIIGRSMGAVTTLMYTPRDSGIVSIVLDSPFSSLRKLSVEVVNDYTKAIPNFLIDGALSLIRNSILQEAKFNIDDINPLQSAKIARAPALFIASKEDVTVKPHHTEELYSEYSGLQELVFIKGGHNADRNQDIKQTVTQYFKQHFLQQYRTQEEIKLFSNISNLFKRQSSLSPAAKETIRIEKPILLNEINNIPQEPMGMQKKNIQEAYKQQYQHNTQPEQYTNYHQHQIYQPQQHQTQNQIQQQIQEKPKNEKVDYYVPTPISLIPESQKYQSQSQRCSNFIIQSSQELNQKISKGKTPQQSNFYSNPTSTFQSYNHSLYSSQMPSNFSLNSAWVAQNQNVFLVNRFRPESNNFQLNQIIKTHEMEPPCLNSRQFVAQDQVVYQEPDKQRQMLMDQNVVSSDNFYRNKTSNTSREQLHQNYEFKDIQSYHGTKEKQEISQEKQQNKVLRTNYHEPKSEIYKDLFTVASPRISNTTQQQIEDDTQRNLQTLNSPYLRVASQSPNNGNLDTRAKNQSCNKNQFSFQNNIPHCVLTSRNSENLKTQAAPNSSDKSNIEYHSARQDNTTLQNRYNLNQIISSEAENLQSYQYRFSNQQKQIHIQQESSYVSNIFRENRISSPQLESALNTKQPLNVENTELKATWSNNNFQNYPQKYQVPTIYHQIQYDIDQKTTNGLQSNNDNEKSPTFETQQANQISNNLMKRENEIEAKSHRQSEPINLDKLKRLNKGSNQQPNTAQTPNSSEKPKSPISLVQKEEKDQQKSDNYVINLILQRAKQVNTKSSGTNQQSSINLSNYKISNETKFQSFHDSQKTTNKDSNNHNMIEKKNMNLHKQFVDEELTLQSNSNTRQNNKISQIISEANLDKNRTDNSENNFSQKYFQFKNKVDLTSPTFIFHKSINQVNASSLNNNNVTQYKENKNCPTDVSNILQSQKEGKMNIQEEPFRNTCRLVNQNSYQNTSYLMQHHRKISHQDHLSSPSDINIDQKYNFHQDGDFNTNR